MIRGKIKKDLEKALQRVGFGGQAPKDIDVEVTRSQDPKFGDFSTNIALKLSGLRQLTDNQSTIETAKTLADSLKNLPYVKKLEVAGGGFINFFIKDEYWQKEIGNVLLLGDKYGSNKIGSGKKARVEFVSANPTGPLHFGNARGGPIGDALANVLEFSGWKVLREYYHNDIGEQVRKLGESIVNVSKGQNIEEQEYKGQYVKGLVATVGKVENAAEAGQKAVKILLGEILADCEAMGIKFGKVFAESQFSVEKSETKSEFEHLSRSVLTESVIQRLAAKNFLKEKDNALWFAPNDEFLKDRECVVKKSDGNYTYFANDIAYHSLKFDDDVTGFGEPNLVVDILGANHHGHVPRLQAAIAALGHGVSKFHVILYQWVRFMNLETLELLTMSKRLGAFVTAREVLDGVGKDALRFFILMHDPSSHIDFDLSLAMRKSKENPVYYVQYAHARICSILAKTKVKIQKSKVNYQLLTTNYELDLMKQITRLPELICDIAASFSVHQLTSYAIALADSFHKFYENCPVLTSNEDLRIARLALCRASQITLSNTLKLLGVSAPEKM